LELRLLASLSTTPDDIEARRPLEWRDIHDLEDLLDAARRPSAPTLLFLMSVEDYMASPLYESHHALDEDSQPKASRDATGDE